MRFNFNRLRGRIIEKFGSCAAFATKMGQSSVWISYRLNNVVQWAADDIIRACELLDIPPEEIPVYFFELEFR